MKKLLIIMVILILPIFTVCDDSNMNKGEADITIDSEDVNSYYNQYEIARPVDFTFTDRRTGKKLQISIPKVVVAYDKNNKELSRYLNNKGAILYMLIKDTLSGQNINDLTDSRKRETTVKEKLVEDINRHLNEEVNEGIIDLYFPKGFSTIEIK